MAKGIAQVVVRRQRGKLNVQGLGQTPRGQSYIKKSVVIEAATMADKNFKAELSDALKELFE